MEYYDKKAAVSMVLRDNKILAVWNRRYEGWAMPGGMVEDRETIKQTQTRKLKEETGLDTIAVHLSYEAPVEGGSHPDRATYAYLFQVLASDEPKEMETGCPIRWMTKREFLKESPFKEWYKAAFLALWPNETYE